MSKTPSPHVEKVTKYLRAQPKNIFIDKRVIEAFVPHCYYALSKLVEMRKVEARKGRNGGYRLCR